MTNPTLKISTPGSIMITGEHAVVYGHPAIVCAIDQRVTIAFKPRQDRLVEVHSEICEPQSQSIDDAKPEGPLRYVFGAIALYRDKLTHGFDIKITSEINPALGLGSSAAVAIAMLGGLKIWTEQGNQGFALPQDLGSLHNQALHLVRSIQGRGSGADLAASLHGGMLAYQLPENMLTGADFIADTTNASANALPNPPEMSLRYCGYKTPTGTVLAQIAEQMKGREEEFASLYARMGDVAALTIDTAGKKDWLGFFEQINAYQTLMEELGVSDATLDGLIRDARTSDGNKAVKISGSGLGDCILAFGPCPKAHTPAMLAKTGLRIEDAGTKA